MSNRKAPERRSDNTNGQDQSDLNVAITELHQTIARLNRVIDQVKDDPKDKEKFIVKSSSSDRNQTNDEQSKNSSLDLFGLVIPRVFH